VGGFSASSVVDPNQKREKEKRRGNAQLILDGKGNLLSLALPEKGFTNVPRQFRAEWRKKKKKRVWQKQKKKKTQETKQKITGSKTEGDPPTIRSHPDIGEGDMEPF